MAKKRSKKTESKPAAKNANGASLGFEEKLWLAADKLRGSIDAAEYKHVVLGLLFLKYISDAFGARREELEALCDDDNLDDYLPDDKATVIEDRDEYLSANVSSTTATSGFDASSASVKPRPLTMGMLMASK